MIVTVYCGDLPGKLRKRYPGEKILTFPETRGNLAAIRKADDGSPIRLMGYSAGCSGVRELCAAGLAPAEVFTFDGTHASLPKRPQTMPLGEWRDLFARANRGELTWIASHIYNTYTDSLPAHVGPYMSTVRVLREVTGEALPMPAEGAGPTYTRLPGMVIASYRSGPCDKDAHGKQINTYAEQLCEGFLGLDARPLGPSVGTMVANALGAFARLAWPFSGAGMALGAAVLQEALKSLEAGVAEAKGKPNAGLVVDAWLAEVGAPSPNNWCAAAVSHWIRMASSRLGVKQPIAGSAGAKATKAQFEKAGRWVDVAKVRADKADLIPGMVPVWHRGKPGDWTGHIGILETVPVDGIHFTTVEGNSGKFGTEVARMTRRLDDPLLLGFGKLDL